jgi:hypothetical protein
LIDFLSTRRIVVFADRVDFRKQWNGLLTLARHAGFDPYEGDVIVFIKRDKTQLRALAGDDRGLVLVSRRFEGKVLPFLFDGSRRTLTRSELALWFEGADFTVHSRASAWR